MVNFNDTTPAAPSGKTNVVWQQSGTNVSAYVATVGVGVTTAFGVTIDGGGSAITTGHKGYLQLPYACTITGWSCIADASGSISCDVDAKASSAPNAAPAIPNTTTDKISASAPIALSTQQSASGGATQVSTWTTTRAQWDVFGFNVTSATTVTRVTIMVTVTRT